MSTSSATEDSPPSWSIPPLESSVPLPSALAPFPSVQERYYTRFHTRDEAFPAQCVLLHSNRICLVTLGPGHPVVKGEKVVERVNFQVRRRASIECPPWEASGRGTYVLLLKSKSA